ncbi:hypothetical protein, partial [Salmonella enterica]|uniref:phage nozzle protein n=1 Tax=Salmonella enterica TaxID=28901 RepID=UPI003CFAE0BC
RAAIQLPDGSQSAHVNEVDGQAIAEKLAVQLRNNLGNPNNEQDPNKWRFNVGPGFIHILAPNNDNVWGLQTKDGY